MTVAPPTRILLLLVLSGAVAALCSSSWANLSKNPEQETAEIAKLLKPIPDDEWTEIAGDRISEAYSVVDGDNLYDISKRLFGDGKYWPKIWAINNGAITNPHYVVPGESVAFQPGTGTSLPSVSVNTAENSEETSYDEINQAETTSDADEGRPRTLPSRKSREWKLLPKQAWENVQMRLPPEVDPLGFDRRSRVKTRGVNSYTLDLVAASKKADPIGRIIGAEKENNTIESEEIVFISSTRDLHGGEVYGISDLPFGLKSPKTHREGFSYGNLGSVRIIDKRGTLFVGVIENARYPFYRGSILVPLPAKVSDISPVPGPSPIEGTLLLDRFYSTRTVAQHRLVFIDRGTDDGVQKGMVFRSYQHLDNSNGLKLTQSNVLIDADLMVVQTSETFSTAMILSSYSYVIEGTSVTLLTDVTDLLKANPRRRRIEKNKDGTVSEGDWLDKLDSGNALGDDEKKELQQLEQYKDGNGTAPLTAPVPPLTPTQVTPTSEAPAASLPPAPEAELPPPPSNEALPVPPSEQPNPLGAPELPPPPPENPAGSEAPAPAPPPEVGSEPKMAAPGASPELPPPPAP